MDKEAVKEFWDEVACGEELLLTAYHFEGYATQASERYRIEPYIIPFPNFEKSSGLAVLEIGRGLGADHEGFALAGANLSRIDLTPHAVKITGLGLELNSLETDLLVGGNDTSSSMLT